MTALPPAHAETAQPGHDAGLWQRDVLSGDWDGLRTEMEDKGFRLYMDLTAEIFANLGGGERTGSNYEDLVELGLDVDLERAADWKDALIHINGYLTHGRGVSAHELANNYLTVSNIEADRGDRLFDLYFQQFLLQGAFSVRIGQLAASDEFFVSRTAAQFLNGSYGWPAIMSANLPGGGPNYPLATPGIRLAFAPAERVFVQIAAFNGNPAGPGPGGAPPRNPSGTSFRLGDGSFLIGEAALRGMGAETNAATSSGYKLGVWYHTHGFSDLAADNQGRDLADPASTGQPLVHSGNYGTYLVVDQVLARTGESGAVMGFLRASISPGDRNVIAGYVDAGMTAPGIRDSDIVGLAFAYAGISGNARAYDRAVRQFADPLHPVRNFEADVELTYQTNISPWWILQPDFQLVVHPRGQIESSGRVIPNAFVSGIRSVILF